MDRTAEVALIPRYCRKVSVGILLAPALAMAQGEFSRLWENVSDAPWVRELRERNERRLPVCVVRLPEAQNQVRQNERDEPAWETIGRCKLQEGAVDEAISAFRRILRMHPSRADVFSLLGLAQLRKGDRELARELFEVAIRMDPEEDQAYRGLGAYHAGGGNLRTAIENYEEALQLANPQGPNVFNPDEDYRTVSFLYAKLGKPTIAVRALERAVQLNFLDTQLHYQYGLALVATAQREKALEVVRHLETFEARDLAKQLAARVKDADR